MTKDSYTFATQRWLDQHLTLENGGYRPHAPVFGYGSPRTEFNQAGRIVRIARILSVLDSLSFDSFLDVGGCEGYTARLVCERKKVDVAFCDLSRVAVKEGITRLGVPGVACQGAALPFPDNSFDVVLCSEVLEHVEDPFSVINELKRVARRHLLITTSECLNTEWERLLTLRLRDPQKEHEERNWWLPKDFEKLLGLEGTSWTRQMHYDCVFSDFEKDEAVLIDFLKKVSAPTDLKKKGVGIMVLHSFSPSDSIEIDGIKPDPRLWDILISGVKDFKEVSRSRKEWLFKQLVCPACLTPFSFFDQVNNCSNCGVAFGFSQGVHDFTISPDSIQNRQCLLLKNEIIKLESVLDIKNVWQDRFRRGFAWMALAVVGVLRDIKMGKPFHWVRNSFYATIRQSWQEWFPLSEKSLVRAYNHPDTYIIESRTKRHIPSMEVFHAHGFNPDKVREVSKSSLDKLPEGLPLENPRKEEE